ncbi:uncharacterized protein A4U43_C07F38530 [Asparagus officinalis]|uniref:F-box/LRR-repeat protein 15-like leucin rich repeat domain-containing protein n=1 Tax=Asparagus officinalis TaxID=4686 RepID=A0A5P1EI13_ASPOF|nr:uncharacterized protein A4U43_C07F38530 [Asparagus officinalis]
MGEDEEESSWAKETTPKIIKIICSRNNPSLSQRDLYSLLLVSPSCYRALLSVPNLWETLDLREVNRAGEKLISALSLERYRNVKRINLEFARDVEDEHLVQVKSKAFESLQGLECLNLNGCQKISDKGVDAITSVCPEFRTFSIYWNVRITDLSIKHLVKNCKHITDLNLSGCKNLTDHGLSCIARCKNLVSLNLTWCVRITDVGVVAIAQGCRLLEFLSSFPTCRGSSEIEDEVGEASTSVGEALTRSGKRRRGSGDGLAGEGFDEDLHVGGGGRGD